MLFAASGILYELNTTDLYCLFLRIQYICDVCLLGYSLVSCGSTFGAEEAYVVMPGRIRAVLYLFGELSCPLGGRLRDIVNVFLGYFN